MSKEQLIARLDAARWQLRRDLESVSLQFAQRTSVRGQLQESIRRQPSVWGVGAVVAGFVLTRLLFGKKPDEPQKKASPPRRRWPVFGPLGGVLLKMTLSIFQPSLTKVAAEKVFRLSNSHSPHV